MFKQRKLLKILSMAIILIAIVAPLLPTGCDNKSGEISAELGEEVDLKIGETVSIEDESLKIKFTEVVGDSRCPTGATCVWEGEVSCALEITYLDESYTKTIVQPGLTQQNSTDIFQEYEITFGVQPYPEVDKEIKHEEYRLQMVIDRNP